MSLAPTSRERRRFVGGLAVGMVPSWGLVVVLVAAVRLVRGAAARAILRSPALLMGALGATLLTLPALRTGWPSVEALAPWLAVLVFYVARVAGYDDDGGRVLGNRTFVAGAAVAVVALALVPLAALAVGREVWLAGWTAHPNLWAAKVVTLATAVMSTTYRVRVAVPVVAAAAATCLATGSRAALLALVAGLVLLAVRRLVGGEPNRRSARRSALATLGLLAVSLAATLLGPWRTHVTEALPIIGTAPLQSVNRVPASEAIGAAPWRTVGVRIEPLGLREDAAVVRVVKTEPRTDARAVAPITIASGREYRVSVDLAAPFEGRPGVHGWSAADTGPAVTLSVYLEGGTGTVAVRGPVTAEVERVEALGGGWIRMAARFRIAGDGMRTLWFGPAPDLGGVATGASVEVSRLQVAPADAPTAYEPTQVVSPSRWTAVGRLAIYQDAWRGFLAAPLLGHGLGSFATDQAILRADRDFAVTHAHNLFLHTAYEGGAIALAGLALLLVTFLSGPWRPGRLDAAVLVGTVLVMNTFDLSFWSAGVLLPLAAFTGWRASARPAGADVPQEG
ncbi:MAG: O-antigen ligase family protein [Trueperaceae bacterium]